MNGDIKTTTTPGSNVVGKPAAAAPKRDIQWADGIRGIACVLVVIAHFLDAFYWPSSSFDRPHQILTLPIMRLTLQGGFLAVAIFFVISGYVCAMKPLKLSRARKPDEARKAIASAAFRRVLRLGAPATLATGISWGVDRLGGFELAKGFPAGHWIVAFSPPRYGDFREALRGLFHACLRTWTYDGITWTTARNPIEGIQWTMAYELRGSMLVYLLLGVTASFTPTRRFLCMLAIVGYSIYADKDVLSDLPFYLGAILADISLVLNEQSTGSGLPFFNTRTCDQLRRGGSKWAIGGALVGLYVGSYPPNSYELARWSRQLHDLGELLFPETFDLKWTFPLLGTLLLLLSIHFSPPLRRLLSHRYFVFLGSISFPMYLLHSMLMRSVLVWIIYGLIPDSGGIVRRLSDYGYTSDGDTEFVEGKSVFWSLVTLVAMAGWFGLLTFLSVLWKDRLDGYFLRFAQWGEEIMLGRGK